MIKVTVLALRNTMASTVIGPMDIFYQAGTVWNYYNNQEVTPFFEIEMVSSNGQPFRSLSGARMIPTGSIYDVEKTDLLVISSIVDIERTVQNQSEVFGWIKEQYENGAKIATICSGAMVLAETGLLDGKKATTHWLFAEQFRKRYPKVKLMPDQLLTDEGDIYCAGGSNAGIDLSLYLVEKYCGREIAVQSSKTLVTDFSRSSQAPYMIFQAHKTHTDEPILVAQEWIEENFDQNFKYDELAGKSGLGRRTFERRFKTATGETPLSYQQRIRVEKAKYFLENGQNSFDEITFKVGYEDSSSFRKIFLKHTNLRPGEYRKKFQRIS